MRTMPCLVLLAATAASAGCLDLTGLANEPFERTIERSFAVKSGAIVEVEIDGGSIVTRSGPAGSVRVSMHQRLFTATQAEAERALGEYDVTLTDSSTGILVRARRRLPGFPRSLRNHSFATTVELPDDVRLRLKTSGGRIDVAGDRAASLDAVTSGGAIQVHGGTGDISLQTSGGSVRVSQALGGLKAHTSGGSITVGYVGPSVPAVDLETSGGTIRAAIDTAARFDLLARTSGGWVDVGELDSPSAERRNRTQATLTLNGGGRPFRAETSGGNVELRRAP